MKKILFTFIMMVLFAPFALHADVVCADETMGFNNESLLEKQKLQEINGHEYVDLGLPSGLLWATCNVGASTPKELGGHYAWGEINTKESYTSSNCSTYGVQMNDISGNPQYDAATANWGGIWRMPTSEEQQELYDKCEWERTTLDGVDGFEVRGPNGNSIFMPTAGYYEGTYNFEVGEYMNYYSSTPYDDYMALFLCDGNSNFGIIYDERYEGRSIRPVAGGNLGPHTENYWTPDETVYPNNMTLTGLVEIDGEVQNTTSLEVGAFCGDELRGSYRLQYIPALEKHLVFLVIYGNDNDEITFKLYDHDLGQELDYQMLPGSAVNFEVNKVEGNADEPFVIAFQEIEYATSFFFDFNDGTLDGWTLIDADGDGHNWKNTSEFAYEPFGYNNTYCAASFSYDNEDDVLWPNNYLVTESKYNIVADSKLTYKVSSHDRIYCAEHYEVAISTTGTNPNDFVTIYEETLSAGEADYEGSLQGQWFDREIDLSVFAGQKVYIAFRHCLCSNQYFMKLDNITLTSDSTPEDPETPEYAQSFSDDFNDHNLDGWRTIDQDGDNYTWKIPNRNSYLLSETYDDSNGEVLYPDNIIVTTELYRITETSVFEWDVKPSNNEFFEEHYAVVFSTDNETFDIIWEETLTSFNVFEQRVLSLSEYAGQKVYIGFRHYDCDGSTAEGLMIDNVELSVDKYEFFEITANVNPEEAGTVDGAGGYLYGETATLTAIANYGYQFANWTENGEIVSEDAEYSFTVENARELVANFELQTFNVTVTADPADYGNVTGSGSYQYGETATLTATANDGYQFVNWTENGEVVSEEAEYSFEVTEDRVIVANFTIAVYNVTAMPNDEFAGTVSGAGEFLFGETATLTAMANEGYLFANWTENDTVVSEDSEFSFTVTMNRNLVANFEQTVYETAFFDDFNDGNIDGWRLFQNDSDTENWKPVTSVGIDGTSCITSYSYNGAFLHPDNYIVTKLKYAITESSLFAFASRPADGGYYRDKYGVVISEDGQDWTVVWSEQFNEYYSDYRYKYVDLSEYAGQKVYIGLRHYECSGEDANNVLIDNIGLVDGPSVVVVSANPEDAGTVGGAGEYLFGETATLTAYANYGYQFVNWTENGGIVSENAEYYFTVVEDRELVANFEEIVLHEITANANPEDAGIVDGTGEYIHGETATLTAYANIGYKFVNWTENGEVVSEDTEYSFVVESARELIANFEEVGLIGITAIVNPEETGTVDGTGEYLYGETATLTAIANDGYQFVNWTENDTVVSEDAEYSFIVEGARELVANFALPEAVFFDDFNDGNIDGWRLIDVDGDGYNWEIYNSTSITSYSYKSGNRNPDNYIVTRLKYSITENSVLVFTSRPCAQSYYSDKYGVVVSEDGQDWTVVWSEQFNEYYSDYRYKYVDLSEYAGKAVYIGFRHYDTDSNQAENVLVDDVELTTEYVKFIGEGSWSDASNWLNSQKPESTDKVFVNGNAVMHDGDNVSVYELCINSGKSLTIEGGASLSVAAKFVNYDKDALIMNDGAQLFQNNENVYATFNMNMVNPTGTWGENDKTGWQFVSSPITNSPLSAFVPSEGYYDLYKYDGTASGAEWNNYKDGDFETEFISGRGYLASYEIDTTATFKGVLNNASSFNTELSYYGDAYEMRFANFYLLGNPFTFNMDWSNISVENVYEAFATVDPLTGGYVNSIKSEVTTIPVGDGFFVEATGEYPSISYNAGSKSRGEKVEYINVVASGKQGSNNVIIKLSGKEEKGFSKLENLNQSIADIYVKNNGRQYSVLGYDNDVKEVELFFDAKEMGNYSISIEPNGKFESVTLVDRMTGIETNMLIEDKYTFTAMANDNPNRFVLKFANGQEPTANSQFAYMNNGDIVIYNISGDAQINIFDALGRCVYQGESSDATTRIASVYSAGVYVIQKVDDNGVNVQKLIINE